MISKKTKMPEATEHQTQTAIVNYLQATGWYVMRLNSGKYSVGEGRSKRFIMGQVAGTPDLMAFRKFKHKIGNVVLDVPLPELFFIEVKRKGNKPTFYQEQKMKELEEYGALCMVAHSFEEVQERLKEYSK